MEKKLTLFSKTPFGIIFYYFKYLIGPHYDPRSELSAILRYTGEFVDKCKFVIILYPETAQCCLTAAVFSSSQYR